MSRKEIIKKNKEFFSSNTWLDYMQEKKDRKKDKREAIKEERRTHNKSKDELSCKQRRKQQKESEGKLYGFAWYRANIK